MPRTWHGGALGGGVQADHESEWAALNSVAAKWATAETVRQWVRRADVPRADIDVQESATTATK